MTDAELPHFDVEREPLGPPGEGAIQRRCWTITNAGLGVAQCWLFNGHDGPHQWTEAEAAAGLDEEALASARPDGSSFVLTRHFFGGWTARYESGPAPTQQYGYQRGNTVHRTGKGDTAAEAMADLAEAMKERAG